jgi:transmembrane sensor
MSRQHQALEALGARVSETEARVGARSDFKPRVRARLLQSRGARTHSGELWRLAAFTAVGALLATALIVVIQRSQAALSFIFDQGAAPGLGAPLRSSSIDAVLKFSDGTKFTLGADAQLRVVAVDHDGARVVVDHGRARAEVVHRDAARWIVDAGPFEVRVTGTSFDVAWSPESSTFDLRVQNGSVVVSGCSMAAVAVTAGQELKTTCQWANQPDGAPSPVAEIELDAMPVSSGSGSQNAAAPRMRAAAGADAAADAEPSAPIAAAVDAGPGPWVALAAVGRYRDAYAAADAAGFEAVCDRAGADELLTLADAALYAGRGDRSRATLLKLREKYPGTSAAAVAAFRLGRAAFDGKGAYAEASQWFRTYLREQPGGGFSREATGRLLEIDHLQGNAQGARTLARQYLQVWPSGPHAPLARAILGED